MEIWMDASLSGLAFVVGQDGFRYRVSQSSSAKSTVSVDIFFLEMLVIVSALDYASMLDCPPTHLLIHSDSLDSIEVFSSMCTSNAMHNNLLVVAASIIVRSCMDLQVVHIDGINNIRADLLSRSLIDDFYAQYPSHCIHSFIPPRELLPA